MSDVQIFMLSLIPLAWIYYQVTKRIGEDQALDWKDFVKDNPHLFQKPVATQPRRDGGMDDEQKKSM